MTDKELMQQALDALESVFEGDDKGAEYWTVTGGTYEAVECMQVMRALRARLAQPENDFNPDWDAMAVMVKEQQRMAKRIEELEARLAQPEQEPVAWGVPNTRPTEKAQFMMLLHSADGCQYPDQLVPLYTAPPQREWQGLTDDEVRDFWSWSMTQDAEHIANTQQHAFARAIEDKLKEKNT
jgi:succinate dehydrogenase flavin-adding protein (antitoxin of CptAB toxin-antitoxin module)